MTRRSRTSAERRFQNPEDQKEGQEQAQKGESEDADVVLDVHELSIKEVNVEVEKLQAHLSLDARIADLLQLRAGVDIEIDDVNITLTGVETDAHLRVRLDEVREIIDRTFASIDENPELYRGVLGGGRSGTGVEGDEPADRASEGRGILRRILPGGGGEDAGAADQGESES